MVIEIEALQLGLVVKSVLDARADPPLLGVYLDLIVGQEVILAVRMVPPAVFVFVVQHTRLEGGCVTLAVHRQALALSCGGCFTLCCSRIVTQCRVGGGLLCWLLLEVRGIVAMCSRIHGMKRTSSASI